MADVFNVWSDVQLHPAIRKRDAGLLDGEENLKPGSFGHLKLPLCGFHSLSSRASGSNLLSPLIAGDSGIRNERKEAKQPNPESPCLPQLL